MKEFIPSIKKIINFNFATTQKQADHLICVLPFWQTKEIKAEYAGSKESNFKDELEAYLHLGDFKGEAKEVACFYPKSEKIAYRLILIGLGEKKEAKSEIALEQLREAYASVVKWANGKKFKNLSCYLPVASSLSEEEVLQAMIEGMLFANYSFDLYKTKKNSFLEEVSFLAVKKNYSHIVSALTAVFQGVNLARDLVNSSADEVTPEYLVNVSKAITKESSSIKAKILNRKQLEKEKLGLILSVGRASSQEPHLIILEYTGAKGKNAEKTVLVGKGVTYDTGGLNLKPTGFMETMRCDMGGAATVLGTIYAAALLKLPVNITAVVPTVENVIDSLSYKPGDVYKSYNGTTVEIANTDAEGRLILADAISYAVKNLSPTRIIDYATLTGAMVVALGEEVTGMMSSDDLIAQAFTEAGFATYERIWRLPIYEEYAEALKSEVADIKNVGDRSAGAIAAALFLKRFVGDMPWAHFDIAGTAFISKDRRYLSKGATGVGVRFTLKYLQGLTKI